MFVEMFTRIWVGTIIFYRCKSSTLKYSVSAETVMTGSGCCACATLTLFSFWLVLPLQQSSFLQNITKRIKMRSRDETTMSGIMKTILFFFNLGHSTIKKIFLNALLRDWKKIQYTRVISIIGFVNKYK